MKCSLLIAKLIVITLTISICGCGGELIDELTELERNKLLNWEEEAPKQVKDQITLLRRGDVTEKRSAIHALGSMGEKAKGAILALFEDLECNDSNVVRGAQEALVRIGDPAVEPLIGALKCDELCIRGIIIETLVKIGESAVDSLIVALKTDEGVITGHKSATEESDRVDAVIEALAKFGESAVDPLTVALKHDESPRVRSRAASALGSIGGIRAVESLTAAFEDRDHWVRVAAVEALGNVADSAAVESLIAALKHRDSSVRFRAATSLGDIGDIRAVEPLIAALTDDDWQVRERAGFALSEIGGSRVVTAFVNLLIDRGRNDIAVKNLRKLGWQPSNMTDRVHFLAARRNTLSGIRIYVV